MVNHDAGRLASRELAARLRADIEEGDDYPPGTKLPSYRRLAETHGVAPNTAQAAVRLLEAVGLVTIKPKSGVYISDPSKVVEQGDDLRAELTDLHHRLHQARKELATAERDVAALLQRLPKASPDQ
ncbi:winged helix-turn-helix domain-containing protein [Spirillospora sp. NPDC048911]|uniref:winged helix-turn-helix domain-containing protein n=1 Tax=Spirillospora sp. NPDC048911 TaxID=3364527 RepID=UPI0037171F8A